MQIYHATTNVCRLKNMLYSIMQGVSGLPAWVTLFDHVRVFFSPKHRL